MKRDIKSISKTFNDQVHEITKVLHGYRHFTKEIKKCFEKLGYVIKKSNKHFKCFYKNMFVTTIASTPSDTYAANQIIRHIRTFWEDYECSKNKGE